MVILNSVIKKTANETYFKMYIMEEMTTELCSLYSVFSSSKHSINPTNS